MEMHFRNLDLYEKAYKAICHRLEAEKLHVQPGVDSKYFSNAVVAVASNGRFSYMLKPGKASSYPASVFLKTPSQLLTHKDFVDFMVRSAEHGDVMDQHRRLAVHEGESLESLAVEFDLGE